MAADLLSAVAQPHRQQILFLVWQRERAAGDIAAHFHLTFGAVSQHLRILRDTGAVSMTKRGRQRFYRANRNALGPLAQHLAAMWTRQLTELKRLAEAE